MPFLPFEVPVKREPEICCPKCGYRPKAGDRWQCVPSCGTSWNTFWTGGVCPGCGHRWTRTQCPRCGEISPHRLWYRYPTDEPQEEVGSEVSPLA